MRSVVWRVGGGVCNRILSLARPMGQLVQSRALVVVAATVTIAGCAPYYYEPGDGAYDAADAAGTSRARPKPRIPVPSRALLTPQPEPRCEELKSTAGNVAPAAKSDPKRLASADGSDESARAAPSPGEGTAAAAAAPAPAAKDADASLALALRIKLEYERECYRQAEARVRGRLQQLQGSVSATVKAVETQNRQQ